MSHEIASYFSAIESLYNLLYTYHGHHTTHTEIVRAVEDNAGIIRTCNESREICERVSISHVVYMQLWCGGLASTKQMELYNESLRLVDADAGTKMYSVDVTYSDIEGMSECITALYTTTARLGFSDAHLNNQAITYLALRFGLIPNDAFQMITNKNSRLL